MARKVGAKKVLKRPVKKPVKRAMASRADLGADVSLYFDDLSGWQQRVARRLDRVVRRAVPRVEGAIKWGMPVYEHHGMLCYVRAWPRYVTLGFYFSGTALDDPRGVLTGTGANMRHVKIREESEVNEGYLAGLVRQAARLNAGM